MRVADIPPTPDPPVADHIIRALRRDAQPASKPHPNLQRPQGSHLPNAYRGTGGPS
jgi:hypothetical protein